MALTIVIEDGTGSNAAANSYATEAEFDTHFEVTNIDITAITSDQKKSGLIAAATLILELCYKYKGTLTHSVSPVQPLLWPRTGLYDRRGISIGGSTIPTDIKTAQIELARQIAIHTNYLYQDSPSNTGAVKKEKLDVLAKEYYGPGSAAIISIASSAESWVTKILAPYLTGGYNPFQINNQAVT